MHKSGASVLGCSNKVMDFVYAGGLENTLIIYASGLWKDNSAS